MAYAESDDQLLSDVRSARQGDSDAYARIIRRFQQPLARRMQRFARGQGEVEELVHEIFVEAYFSLDTYRADAPFEHWLQRIATRVGYRHWKKSRQRSKLAGQPLELAEHVAAAESDSKIPASEAAETLAALLEQLPPRDRLVVTLLHVEGHSVEQTAQLTGWSRTMVKVQAYRARGKLRKLIEASATARPGSSGGVRQ